MNQAFGLRGIWFAAGEPFEIPSSDSDKLPSGIVKDSQEGTEDWKSQTSQRSYACRLRHRKVGSAACIGTRIVALADISQRRFSNHLQTLHVPPRCAQFLQ